MHILVVTQYFWPENFRVNDLVAELVHRGYQVTVLTGFPNYPSGRIDRAYRWFRRCREQFSGADVVRVPLIPRGAGGPLSLLANYASFAFCASVFGPLRLPRDVEIIFVHQPSPITVGLPAIVMKRWMGARILFWVLDLWPESVAAAGAVRSPRVLGWIGKLVRFIYSRCDRILVPSRAFVPHVRAAGIDEARISYFPNWAEPGLAPCPRSDPPPAVLPAGFRVMLAGNIGVAQDFPAILTAAELLRSAPNIHWIVVGVGRMLDWVRKEVGERKLEATVHLLGQHAPASMPQFFAHADVMLLALRREAIFASTVPARLQAYFACARPVVGMLDGEGARIIEEAQAGVACPAGDAAALAAAVRRLSEMDAVQRERLGANGLAYSRTQFGRQLLFDRLESWIREAAAARDMP